MAPVSGSSTAKRLPADDRREQIVRAGQKLFAQRPYEEVSTGDIAAAAGTTRTNIHYHFSTKRDLFLEIIRRFSRIPDDLGRAVDPGTVEDRVNDVFHRWLDAIDRNRETFITMLHATSSRDPQVAGVLAESMGAWEIRLLRIVGMDPGNPTHRAMVRSFQAMISEATAAWIEHGTLDKSQVHTMLSRCLIAVGASASSGGTIAD